MLSNSIVEMNFISGNIKVLILKVSVEAGLQELTKELSCHLES